ncbi:MAG: hypothetical protein ABIP61_12510, partial [Burkholderiaceae bacterium]
MTNRLKALDDRQVSTTRRALVGSALVTGAFGALPALAQSRGEIRIALIYGKTGPLEAYGKQTQTGFMMGLDYATNG